MEATPRTVLALCPRDQIIAFSRTLTLYTIGKADFMPMVLITLLSCAPVRRITMEQTQRVTRAVGTAWIPTEETTAQGVQIPMDPLPLKTRCSLALRALTELTARQVFGMQGTTKIQTRRLVTITTRRMSGSSKGSCTTKSLGTLAPRHAQLKRHRVGRRLGQAASNRMSKGTIRRKISLRGFHFLLNSVGSQAVLRRKRQGVLVFDDIRRCWFF